MRTQLDPALDVIELVVTQSDSKHALFVQDFMMRKVRKVAKCANDLQSKAIGCATYLYLLRLKEVVWL